MKHQDSRKTESSNKFDAEHKASDLKSCEAPAGRECAQKQLDSDSSCVQCGAMFSTQSVKGVNVLQDAGKHALSLCGQTPEVIMQTALNALHCYIKQTETVGQLRENKLQRRIELLRSQCNDKLQQVHTAYTKAKARAEALASQVQEAQAEREELHSKYQQKNSQMKHLKSQLEMLQQQQQQRGSAGQQHMLVGNGGRGARACSPSTSGPLTGGGQLVTTVHRTQIYDMGNANMGLATPENMPLGHIGGVGGGGMTQLMGQRRPSHGMQNNVLGGGSESPSFVLGATLPNSHNQMQSHKRMSMGHAGGPPGHLLRGSGSGDVRGGVLQPSKRMNLLGSPNMGFG